MCASYSALWTRKITQKNTSTTQTGNYTEKRIYILPTYNSSQQILSNKSNKKNLLGLRGVSTPYTDDVNLTKFRYIFYYTTLHLHLLNSLGVIIFVFICIRFGY